jgi:protein TonB
MAAVTAQTRPLGALGRMGLVAAIHVAVLFAIMKSLGFGPALEEPKTDAFFVDEPQRPDIPPPPLPEVPVVRSTLVLPDIPRELEFEQPETTLTLPPQPEFVETPPGGSAVVQPEIVGVRIDPRNPLSQPPYPPGMVRQGNQGTVDLEVYVLPNGRVGDARVIKSTGWDELDRSAVAEAKRYWRLVPATRDGVAIAQWHKLRVTFKLKNQ